MAYYIRIDNKADYDWLSNLINNSLSRDPNSPFMIENYIYVSNWRKYLDNKVSAKEVAQQAQEPVVVLTEIDVVKTTPKPKPRGRPPAKGKGKNKKAVSKKIVKDPETAYECFAHKTYSGKYKPRTDCEKCWSVFKLLNPMVFKKARADFERAQRGRASSSG